MDFLLLVRLPDCTFALFLESKEALQYVKLLIYLRQVYYVSHDMRIVQADKTTQNRGKARASMIIFSGCIVHG